MKDIANGLRPGCTRYLDGLDKIEHYPILVVVLSITIRRCGSRHCIVEADIIMPNGREERVWADRLNTLAQWRRKRLAALRRAIQDTERWNPA